MRKISFLLICFVGLYACNDTTKEEERIISESSGNINNLTVVLENELWRGSIGETIRQHLAAPVEGLPQEEPWFSISQMPPDAFSGFSSRNRTFLKIEKGEDKNIQIARDIFARPQVGIVIKGQTNEEISQLIEENAERIIDTYKEVELTENQRRIKKSLLDVSKLKEELGVSLKLPTAYRYAKSEEDFFWIRKDIPNGSMEIFVYEVPLSTFEKDTNTIGNIIEMRDSIGEVHVPGVPEGSHMITEKAYAPYLFNSEIDGKFAYETKGTWMVENAFMAGPFLNYAVRDEKNNRYVILEGATFRPSATKRDNMFELEAILKSAQIE